MGVCVGPTIHFKMMSAIGRNANKVLRSFQQFKASNLKGIMLLLQQKPMDVSLPSLVPLSTYNSMRLFPKFSTLWMLREDPHDWSSRWLSILVKTPSELLPWMVPKVSFVETRLSTLVHPFVSLSVMKPLVALSTSSGILLTNVAPLILTKGPLFMQRHPNSKRCPSNKRSWSQVLRS